MTDTSASPYVKRRSVDIDAVPWTDGFWAERFEQCRKVAIPNRWRLLEDPQISHAYENFLVAAGGLRVFADGQEIARSDMISRVTAELP